MWENEDEAGMGKVELRRENQTDWWVLGEGGKERTCVSSKSSL